MGEIGPVPALGVSSTAKGSAVVPQLPTTLRLAPVFASGSSASASRLQTEARPALPSVLDELFEYTDGLVDLNGEPVLFSAGVMENEAERLELVAGLKCGRHYFESFVGGYLDEENPETENQDSMLNPIMESMRAMGEWNINKYKKAAHTVIQGLRMSREAMRMTSRENMLHMRYPTIRPASGFHMNQKP